MMLMKLNNIELGLIERTIMDYIGCVFNQGYSFSSVKELAVEKETTRGNLLFLEGVLLTNYEDKENKGVEDSRIEQFEIKELERFNHYIKVLKPIHRVGIGNVDERWPDIERISDGLLSGINNVIKRVNVETEFIRVHQMQDNLSRLDLTEIDYLIRKYYEGKQCTIVTIINSTEQVLADLETVVNRHERLKKDLDNNRTHWKSFYVDNDLPF